jgi:hypothetical protein
LKGKNVFLDSLILFCRIDATSYHVTVQMIMRVNERKQFDFLIEIEVKREVVGRVATFPLF